VGTFGYGREGRGNRWVTFDGVEERKGGGEARNCQEGKTLAYNESPGRRKGKGLRQLISRPKKKGRLVRKRRAGGKSVEGPDGSRQRGRGIQGESLGSRIREKKKKALAGLFGKEQSGKKRVSDFAGGGERHLLPRNWGRTYCGKGAGEMGDSGRRKEKGEKKATVSMKG